MAFINNGFGTNYSTATYNWLTSFTPDKNITISKIGTSCKHTATSTTLAARIYNSAGQLVASSPGYTCYPNKYTMMELNVPVEIKAGESYYIGFYGSQHSVYTSGTISSMTDGDLTIRFGETIYSGNDNFPTIKQGVSPHSLQIEYKLSDAIASDFNYTGGMQRFIAPYTGKYELEVWGASGGDAGYNNAIQTQGGYGGYAKGLVALTKGEELLIFVGAKGASGHNTLLSNVLGGGYNGGGSGRNGNNSTSRGAGGGGGTDIRRSGSALANRIIVAGGGAGAVYFPSYGVNYPGAGGGARGADGSTSSYLSSGHSGKGGSQSSGGTGGSNGGNADPGTLGFGGSALYNYGFGEAGGGGGYYGGGGSGTGMAAGGGSGYTGGVTQPFMATGVRPGHGFVRVTLDIISNLVNDVKIDKTRILSGDQLDISWSVSTYSQYDYLDESRIKYKIEVNLGAGFIPVVDSIDIDIRSYIYTIPKDSPRFNFAYIRMKSYYEEALERPDDWTSSNSFIIDRHVFAIKSNDKYYAYQNNDWVEINGDMDKNWFYEYGMGELNHIPESKWAELTSPVSLASFTNSSIVPVVDVTVPSYKPIYLLEEAIGYLTVRSSAPPDTNVYLNRVANPHGQLIIQKEDMTLNAPTIPRLIKKITFKGETVGTQTENRRIVISVDKGKSFYTWNDSKWEVLPEISKDTVQTIGMTVEEVNARTEEDWGEIFKGTPRHMRFAYYLEMDLFSDQLSIDEVELLMDITGSWRKASKKDYEYAYPNDEVLQVELFQDGYYKINY